MAATSPLRRVPFVWIGVALALALVTAFPQINLGVTRLFQDADGSFGAGALGELVRRQGPRVIVGSLIVCAGLWIAGLVRRQPIATLTTRRFGYLLSTILLGPGLIVETILKPNWGRARPNEIADFGGAHPYAPPLWITDACASNCSFVSGHAAVAFWVTAYGFLAPQPWRDRIFVAGLLLGAGFGLVRIMQGAHFFSDIVYAGAIVVGVNMALARFVLIRA